MKNTTLNLAQMSTNDIVDIKINNYLVTVYKLEEDAFGFTVERKNKFTRTILVLEEVHEDYLGDIFTQAQAQKFLDLLPMDTNDFEVGRSYEHALRYVPKDKPTTSKTTTKGKGKVKDKPTRAPKRGKGDNKKSALELELDTLAGTGDNRAAHKVMCKHGLKNSNSAEYKAVWQGYWWNIR